MFVEAECEEETPLEARLRFADGKEEKGQGGKGGDGAGKDKAKEQKIVSRPGDGSRWALRADADD